MLVDFAIICASFLVCVPALQSTARAPRCSARSSSPTLPVLLGVRYVLFVLFGIYRRVWRFASPRDLLAIAAAIGALGSDRDRDRREDAVARRLPARDLRRRRAPLRDARRGLAARAASRCRDLLAARRGRARKRVLLVGAGRSGRRLARELRETPDTRVVGFLDDNPRVRRRRVLGVKVLGAARRGASAASQLARPDEVLVTIPDVPPERLDAVVAACAAAGVPCRLVRQPHGDQPPPLVEIPAE